MLHVPRSFFVDFPARIAAQSNIKTHPKSAWVWAGRFCGRWLRCWSSERRRWLLILHSIKPPFLACRVVRVRRIGVGFVQITGSACMNKIAFVIRPAFRAWLVVIRLAFVVRRRDSFLGLLRILGQIGR